MPCCDTCSYMIKNDGLTNVRYKKGMMKPLIRYCTNGCFKEITSRALDRYRYPIWCGLNTCQKTCMECGKRIREEEGDYCKKHRSK